MLLNRNLTNHGNLTYTLTLSTHELTTMPTYLLTRLQSLPAHAPISAHLLALFHTAMFYEILAEVQAKRLEPSTQLAQHLDKLDPEHDHTKDVLAALHPDDTESLTDTTT
jgi:hypothetical protein